MACCALLVASVALAACGGDDASDRAKTSSQESAKPARYPVTVTNCAIKTTYDEPPKRAVTLDQHVTEMMLALGLEDRIVGFARVHSDDGASVPAQYRAAYERLDLIGTDFLSKEVLLRARPDFVFAAFGDSFSAKGKLDRNASAKLGIATYLNPDGCEDFSGPVTFEMLYESVRDLGRIFDVRERAEQLVTAMRAKVARVEAAVAGEARRPPRVFYYDSGEAAAYTFAGAMFNTILRTAGGRNVFGDVKEVFLEANWEEVLDRRPEVVLALDYTASDPPTIAAKRKQLAQRMGRAPALKNDRVVALPLTGLFFGVRSPDTLIQVHEALYPLTGAGG